MVRKVRKAESESGRDVDFAWFSKVEPQSITIILPGLIFEEQGMDTANIQNRRAQFRLSNAEQRPQLIEVTTVPQMALMRCSIHQVEMQYLRNNTYFCPECLGLE
jgi:hypothetical protein